MYVAVKFLTFFGGYNPGEVAGFTKSRAEALVKSKAAEFVVEPKEDLGGTKECKESSRAKRS